MTRLELEQAMLNTLKSMLRIKEEMARACDSKEVYRLRRKLKELQYLQRWQLEKLKRMLD